MPAIPRKHFFETVFSDIDRLKLMVASCSFFLRTHFDVPIFFLLAETCDVSMATKLSYWHVDQNVSKTE